MKKTYILTILFFLSSVTFLVLFLQAQDARQYERNSYEQTLQNFEATDFCLRMALAYCANDTYTLQLHALSEDISVPNAFENGSAAIKGLNQTQYVSDPAAPYATYAIEYIIPAPDGGTVRSIPQTMLVKKDLDSNMWAFAVLALE